MALDPLLLEILACPEDRGPLYYFEDEDALYNPRLHRRYAIRDGIPIMLIDEAETVDDAEAALADRVYPAGAQWSTHEDVLAVGDACFARDALSSQGLAGLISQAHYAVAVESPEDGALYAARAREQRLCHLRSLLGMLSDSRYAADAPWQRYREFVAGGLDSPADGEAPIVVLRYGRLGVTAGGPPLNG